MKETNKLQFESNGNRSSKQNEISAIKYKGSNKCVQTYYNVEKHRIAHPSEKAITNFHVLVVSGRIFFSLFMFSYWGLLVLLMLLSSFVIVIVIVVIVVVGDIPYQFSFHSGPMQIFVLAKNTHMYAHTRTKTYTRTPHTETT